MTPRALIKQLIDATRCSCDTPPRPDTYPVDNQPLFCPNCYDRLRRNEPTEVFSLVNVTAQRLRAERDM